MTSRRIAVVGGSLGGLTAACLLRDNGHDVTVYECSSDELEERGAGIGFHQDDGRVVVSFPHRESDSEAEVETAGGGSSCRRVAGHCGGPAAAATAKAEADGWALAAALERNDDVVTALATWEEQQLKLCRALLERTRRIGSRSQVDNTWRPGDPALIFGLHEPGR